MKVSAWAGTAALWAVAGTNARAFVPHHLSTRRASSSSGPVQYMPHDNNGPNSNENNDHNNNPAPSTAADALAPPHPFYGVLLSTQQWLGDHLFCANKNSPSNHNHVSYVCETSSDPAMIVANVFRKFKEAKATTTQVLVIPANSELCQDFSAFDSIVQAIWDAREAARDYLVHTSSNGNGEEDAVTVTAAHLHPLFGQVPPYRSSRLPAWATARQAPYPTIVLEVASTVNTNTNAPAGTTASIMEQDSILSRLEALLDQSTADYSLEPNTVLERIPELPLPAFSSQGSTNVFPTIQSHSPRLMTIRWMATQDQQWNWDTCLLGVSPAASVEEAFEFVFSSLAVLTTQAPHQGDHSRLYCIFDPLFLPSATSFADFCRHVHNIRQAAYPSANNIVLEWVHPDALEPEHQGPFPTVIWHKQQPNHQQPPPHYRP